MVEFSTTILQFAEKGEKTRWSYICIPSDIAEKLKPGFKKSFRVKGKLDDYPMARQALLPMGNGEFILPLKAAVRKAIHKNKGAMVKLILEEDNRALKVSAELLECLSDSPKAEKSSMLLALCVMRWSFASISRARTAPLWTVRAGTVRGPTLAP